MKYLIFLSVIVTSLGCFAEKRYSVVVGYDRHESLWLRVKNIKKKPVYIIGYQSPQGRILERAMPRKDFAGVVSELQVWKKTIRQRQATSSDPFCREIISVEDNSKPEVLCLDSMARNEKEKFIQWIAKQSDTVAGVY